MIFPVTFRGHLTSFQHPRLVKKVSPQPHVCMHDITIVNKRKWARPIAFQQHSSCFSAMFWWQRVQFLLDECRLFGGGHRFCVCILIIRKAFSSFCCLRVLTGLCLYLDYSQGFFKLLLLACTAQLSILVHCSTLDSTTRRVHCSTLSSRAELDDSQFST